MEREALKKLVDAALGSTKLTGITDETFNHQLDFALGFVTEDSQVDEAFVGKIVDNLKNIDGGVHFKVGEETRSLREKAKSSVQEPVKDAGEPDWFKQYRESQEARISKIEEERSLEKAEAERRSVREHLKSALKQKIASSGREVNDFFVDVTINGYAGETQDLAKAVTELEVSYNGNLKAAGISTDSPFGGTHEAGGGTDWLTMKFNEKAKREGWGK